MRFWTDRARYLGALERIEGLVKIAAEVLLRVRLVLDVEDQVANVLHAGAALEGAPMRLVYSVLNIVGRFKIEVLHSAALDHWRLHFAK